MSPVIRELKKVGIPFKTIFTGQHKELYDDVNNMDCLDENSSLEFFSNNLGYGFIKAYKTKLEVTFLNEENIEEFNVIIKKLILYIL